MQPLLARTFTVVCIGFKRFKPFQIQIIITILLCCSPVCGIVISCVHCVHSSHLRLFVAHLHAEIAATKWLYYVSHHFANTFSFLRFDIIGLHVLYPTSVQGSVGVYSIYVICPTVCEPDK